jgi:hypothetical protein
MGDCFDDDRDKIRKSMENINPEQLSWRIKCDR